MKNQMAIRLLLASNVISGFAQGITMITIPMYFTDLGLSQPFMAAYWVVTLVTLFWTPYAGMLVDKYNRKSIFKWVNLVCGVILSAIFLTCWYNPQAVAVGAGLAFAMTFWNFNIYYACFYSFLQEISEPSSYGTLAGKIEVQGQSAAALAGALAGELLTGGHWDLTGWLGFSVHFPQFSMNEIIGANALAYFVVYLLIAQMRYVPLATGAAEQTSVWERLLTGGRWLWNHPVMLWFGVLSLSVFVIVIIGTYTLYPIYAKVQVDGKANTYAISELCYALGAIVAGMYIQRLFAWTSNTKAIIILTVVTAAKCVFLMLNTSVGLFWSMSFLLGITNAGVRVLRVSYLFSALPNWVSGRVNSLFAVSNTLVRLVFLALFSVPFFHEGNHVIWAFGALAIFLVVSAMGLVWVHYAMRKESNELASAAH